MTEQNATTIETPAPGAEIALETTEPTEEVEIPEDVSQDRKVPREQRYRLERNAAQAEVATLQARLAVLQRAEIERLASAGLSQPSDLFTLSGNELAEYLTDDGKVDPTKVAADVEALLSERPGLKPPSPAVDRTQGFGPGVASAAPTFADFLQS